MTRKTRSETSDQDTSSRRTRLGARRKRRTRATVAIVVVAIAGAAGAAAYVFNANDPQAHAVGSTDNTAAQIGASKLAPSSTAQPAQVRKLSHAAPLNLWVGGDSLAGSFGPALGDQVGATGVVKTVIDYKVSSGLSSNDIRNWYERATEQMAAKNPDAVVFIIGTNDTPIVNRVDANGDKIPDWEAEYRMKVARMMDLLVGPHHRTVFWLGPPTLGADNLDQPAKEIGELMRQEAAKRAPDVTYLDTYQMFAGSDGKYSRTILDENGKEITARISDGTHFTEAGAQYLARAVFKLIDSRWNITKQADLQDPIGWTFADGNGELVPGFSAPPRSRYHSSGNNNSSSNSGTTPQTESTVPPEDTTALSQSPTTFAVTTVPVTSPPTTGPKSTNAPPTTGPPHTTPTT